MIGGYAMIANAVILFAACFAFGLYDLLGLVIGCTGTGIALLSIAKKQSAQSER